MIIEMDESANISANFAADLPAAGRRPGKPKGHPKPPGSGRQKGTTNRVTADIRAVAQKHSAKAIATLVKLLADPDSRVQAAAARELLDRAHGKPIAPTELTGKDGGPLSHDHAVTGSIQLDVARRIAFALGQGVRSLDGGDINVTPLRPAASEAVREPISPPAEPEYVYPDPSAEELGRLEFDRHINRASGLNSGRLDALPVVRRGPEGRRQ